MSLKRVAANSVSEALIEVLEKAEELEQVLILYRFKDSNTLDKEHIGCSHNDELTLRDGNWLVDVYKNWIARASD